MIQPNDLLANMRPLSAILSEIAADPTTMDEEQRLAALDQVIGALLNQPDPEYRVLLLEHATIHLQVGKQLAKTRLARSLDEWRAHLEQQRSAVVAAADTRPPMEIFASLLDSGVDGFTHLLNEMARDPQLLDDAGRLRCLDDMLAVLLTLPDVQLRELYLKQAGEHLGLKTTLVKDRTKRAQAALATPAGQGVVGGEERDRGFHRALIGALKRYLQAHDLYPDAVNGWLDGKGKPTSTKTRILVNGFFLDHASFYESLPRDRIDITLAAMTEAERVVRRRALIGKITGKPASAAGAAALRAWLVATTHRDDPTDYAVMRHWIWQVKRLNSGRTVAWDLMPIFVGKQGDGKSTAIEILCSVLAELMIGINALTLTDDRSTEILGDHAVGFWGEMSGGSKAEVQALKNTLTAKRKSYRELGGHHHNSVIRRMAFIGDSNNQVKDVISDPTGMRRFYEVKVEGPTDRAALNGLDPQLIWECVGEDDPAPFDDVASEVRERQRDLIAQDPFDAFLAWSDGRDWPATVLMVEGQPYKENGQPPTVEIPKYDAARGYTLTEVSALFKGYIRLVGGVVRGPDWVAKRLNEAGWQQHRPKRPGDAQGATKRPRLYLKPEAKGDDGLTDTERDALERAARAAKVTAAPSPVEDLFAAAAERQPGDDEEEGPYRPQGGDDAMPL